MKTNIEIQMLLKSYPITSEEYQPDVLEKIAILVVYKKKKIEWIDLSLLYSLMKLKFNQGYLLEEIKHMYHKILRKKNLRNGM